MAIHDPAKVLLDLAVALGLGGDCLADIALLRAEPGVGTVAFADDGMGQAVLVRRRPARVPAPRSSFAGFRFPPDVFMIAVRWYLRYGLSYRDVE